VDKLRVEWSSSLSLLRDYVSKLSKSVGLSLKGGLLERYVHILFTCLCAAYGRPEFCELVSHNPLLEEPVKIGKAFIESMNRLSKEGLIVSGGSILYATEKVEVALKTREKKPYVVLCDCLSLPEYVYIYDRFSKSIRLDGLLYSINPGGVTRTYEYLTSTILKSQEEEMTMPTLGEALKIRFKATGYTVVRGIDELVHKTQYEKFPSTSDMAVSLYRAIEDIAFKISILSEDYTVLVLSDHGYDVSLEPDGYSLFHMFTGEGACLSLFSAILVVG